MKKRVLLCSGAVLPDGPKEVLRAFWYVTPTIYNAGGPYVKGVDV